MFAIFFLIPLKLQIAGFFNLHVESGLLVSRQLTNDKRIWQLWSFYLIVAITLFSLSYWSVRI